MEQEEADMPVIAMTQEMASLGKDVALGVCEALGLQQVRHDAGEEKPHPPHPRRQG